MDLLCKQVGALVEVHGNDPDKDIRIRAGQNDSTGKIQLYGEEKISSRKMSDEKKESFELALSSVKQAINQIDIDGVDNEEIKDVLFSILNKKMEDGFFRGGHKNSLSMEALHSITAAYENMINPDALEQAITASKVNFDDTPVSFVDPSASSVEESDEVRGKFAATTYSECLDRLNTSSAMIRSQLEALAQIRVDSLDDKLHYLHMETQDKLEDQLSNLENLKDKLELKVAEQGSKPLQPKDHEAIDRLNTLLDTTDELVSEKIELSKFSGEALDDLAIGAALEQELDIAGVDDASTVAAGAEMAAIVQESRELADQYDEVTERMVSMLDVEDETVLYPV